MAALIAAACLLGAVYLDSRALRYVDPKNAFLARFYLLFLIMMPLLVRGWQENRAVMASVPRAAPAYLFGSAVLLAAGLYACTHALSRLR